MKVSICKLFPACYVRAKCAKLVVVEADQLTGFCSCGSAVRDSEFLPLDEYLG